MTTNETRNNSDSKFEGRRHRFGGRKKFLLIPLFFAAFIALKSAVVLLLWNWLIPELFHGPEIVYVQALGIVVLAKVLLGGPRGGFGRGGRFGRGGFGEGCRGGHWGRINDEDRKKLRQKLQDKLNKEFGDQND